MYIYIHTHCNRYSDRSALCLYAVTGWGAMSRVCGMAFTVWQHICQSTTATSTHCRDMTSVFLKGDVKPKKKKKSNQYFQIEKL